MRPTLIVSLASTLAAAGALAAAAAAQQTPKEDIAAQIRDQGYQCDDPQSAARDDKASKPDEAVWVLTCEGASYRVRLTPDMAAQVERLDSDGAKKNGAKKNGAEENDQATDQ